MSDCGLNLPGSTADDVSTSQINGNFLDTSTTIIFFCGAQCSKRGQRGGPCSSLLHFLGTEQYKTWTKTTP